MFYWILEYAKVLVVYMFIMYLWPSVVFRKYLSQKSLTFRFAFCTTLMIMLLNTTILMLGVVKLLNQWIIRALFYGPLIYILGKWGWSNRNNAIHIKYLLTDICSLKRFVLIILKHVGISIRNYAKKLRALIGPNLVLCIFLGILIIYGMIYFSYGAIHEKYYGASDMYVHHSWIDKLLEGKAFGAGVYPEGMHCFIYAMNVLCGVKVYSCLLFLAGIHISAFLGAVYLFFREIFPWKYTGILVLVVFLTMQIESETHLIGLSRLQWTIPQEFGLFAVFLCGTYLLRFLKHVPALRIKLFRWECVRDENLWIFILALAVTIAVHFYVTIFAFFLCCAIGIVFLYWAFKKNQIVPLICAIICGVMISMTPMVVALATGIPFQGSINWAVSIMTSSGEESESEEITTEITQDQETEMPESDGTVSIDDPQHSNDATDERQDVNEESPEPEESLLEKIYQTVFTVTYKSFSALYNENKALLITGSILFGGILGIVCRIITFVKNKNGVGNDTFSGYLIIVIAVLIFMLLYSAHKIGLIEIVERVRLGIMIHTFSIALVFIPLDFIMYYWDKKSNQNLMDICAAVCSLSVCVAIIFLGEYHGYLFNYITRYPFVAEVTDQIMKDMKPYSYTVVAAFDELYHVKDEGFHEEAILFINEITKDTYTLPTEYVFIYVEKQPLVYSHVHFLDGPTWLAEEKYSKIVPSFSSQSPEFMHSVISTDETVSKIKVPVVFNSYKDSKYRTILYTQLNQWVQKFQELYPHQLTTVFENDMVVCYMFRQNPARLLELAIID